MEFINYAHRGASSYAPENTLAAFYLGWQMGANGIETDIRRTKDNVLVLSHDGHLRRTLGLDLVIADMTYEELLKLDFGYPKGMMYKGERIPTLEEFLRHFGGKGLHFAIELKEEGYEDKVLNLIDRYCQRDHVIVTSTIWNALVNMHSVDSDIRLGFLAEREEHLADSSLMQAKKDGFFQICPRSGLLDGDMNRKLRSMGFSVRPWGIDCEETMRRMLNLGVDGMTINFPDVLSRTLLSMGKQANELVDYEKRGK